jgi:2-polyprenyl-3-methyl-5-hydroxy-6-metoxy-1,4-benzoquinol methylase
MTVDPSLGWEAVAERFVAVRSDIGATLVRSWARASLPRSATLLDIGCGSGVPIARTLAADGFTVCGIDASATLAAAYRRNLPDMPVRCEPAQDSTFFGRSFVGAISIGFVFLLDAGDQRRLLAKVAEVLEPGGRFLFSAPRERCEWKDMLTGRPTRSLGADEYAAHLAAVGLSLAGLQHDEGGNEYYDVAKAG